MHFCQLDKYLVFKLLHIQREGKDTLVAQEDKVKDAIDLKIPSGW